MPGNDITLRLVAQDLASGQISKAIGSIDKLAQRGGIAGSVLQGVGVSFGMMLNPAMLAMRATGMVTDAIGGMVSSAADFDDKMTESLAIMGDVSDAMREDMVDAARDVAKTTTYSASEAAEAYYYLASAGLDAAQSIGAMPRVAKFAQAGAFNLARATDLLTDAQSALGLTVDDTAQNIENMTHISDVLVKANTLANASVEQFSTALTSKAGAALKAFGIDVEEGVAVLAAFADQGVKAEEAGNALDRILRLLPDLALKNADAFERMGIEVFDSSGEMNNLGDIVDQLTIALSGLSDAGVQAALSQLGFQARVQGVVKPLLGAGQKIRDYEAALRDAGGTTEEVADKQLTSFNKRLEVVGNKAEVFGQKVGEHIIAPLEGIVEAAGFAIDALDAVGDASANVDEYVTGDQSEAMRETRKRAAELGMTLGELRDAMVALGAPPVAFTDYTDLIDKMGDAAFTTTLRIASVGVSIDESGDQAREAADDYEAIRTALRAINKEIDDFADVRNIDNVNAAIRRTRDAMERAAAKGDAAAFMRRKARYEELRDERDRSKQAESALKLWQKRQGIETAAEQEAADARKAQNREIRMVAKNHEESTKNIRKMLRQQGGDMDAVREKLKKSGGQAETAAGQMDSLATKAKEAADETRMADDALKGVVSTAEVLQKWLTSDNTITVTADTSDATTKLDALHQKLLWLSGTWSFTSREDGRTGSSGGAGGTGRVTQLAEGGIVTRPTFALVGESGPEAVVPLDKGGIGPTINVNFDGAYVIGSADKLADEIGPAIARWMRR